MNQICTRCINDSSIPGIEFNKDGVCNHCMVHDLLCETFPLGAREVKYLIPNLKK